MYRRCEPGRCRLILFFNKKAVAVRIIGADRVVDWEGSEAERVVGDSGRSRGFWSLSVSASGVCGVGVGGGVLLGGVCGSLFSSGGQSGGG